MEETLFIPFYNSASQRNNFKRGKERGEEGRREEGRKGKKRDGKEGRKEIQTLKRPCNFNSHNSKFESILPLAI